MKRFFIDFFIAFIVIVLIFGLSGNSDNVDIDNPKYDQVENIQDYEGNTVNKISFKINNIIQKGANFGFDVFKKILISFLE